MVIETDKILEKIIISRYDRKTIVTIFISIEGLIFRTVKAANKSWDSNYFISNALQPLSQHNKVQDLKKHNRHCLIHTSQKAKNCLINSPCDFGLFGTMKNSFKGQTFDTEKEVLEAIDNFFEEK